MTRTMARAFCAFNALVFFASPVAQFFGFGAYVIGASLVFGLVNLAAIALVSQLRERKAVKAAEEQPTTENVVSIGARAMALKRHYG